MDDQPITIKEFVGEKEPFFILRSSNDLSVPMLKHLAELADQNGRALAAADLREACARFEAWQAANPEKMRQPMRVQRVRIVQR